MTKALINRLVCAFVLRMHQSRLFSYRRPLYFSKVRSSLIKSTDMIEHCSIVHKVASINQNIDWFTIRVKDSKCVCYFEEIYYLFKRVRFLNLKLRNKQKPKKLKIQLTYILLSIYTASFAFWLLKWLFSMSTYYMYVVHLVWVHIDTKLIRTDLFSKIKIFIFLYKSNKTPSKW